MRYSKKLPANNSLVLVYLVEMRCLAFIAFFFVLQESSAQNIHFDKSVFYEQGSAGNILTPNLKLENKGSSAVELVVKRIQQNLPANWYTSLCFQQVEPPEVDSLHFYLNAGETADIGIAFVSDAVEGIGKVKIELRQTVTGQRDTLEFIASTIAAGLKKNRPEEARLFPNPSHDKVFVQMTRKALSIKIIDLNGKTYSELKNPELNFFVDLSNLPAGFYSMIIINEDAVMETTRLIKL